MLRWPLVLFAVLCLVVGLLGCGGGGSPSSPPVFSMVVSSNRFDGTTTTPFELTSQVFQAPEGVAIAWDLGDSRTAQGATLQVTYEMPGVYEVEATATDPASEAVLGTATLSLTVFGSAAPTTLMGTGIPMPERLGDLDLDTLITVADVTLLELHISGTQRLAETLLRNGDFDLDGDLDARDVTLLQEAVALNGVLPSALQPTSGPRSTVVQVVSSHLANPALRAEARVGQAVPVPVRRIHPGYGVFVVPVDAAGTTGIAPVPEGEIPVQLLLDGVLVHTFSFGLTNPPPAQGNEVARIRAVSDRILATALAADGMLQTQLDSLGVSGLDRNVLLATFATVVDQLGTATQDLDRFLRELSPQQAQVAGYLALAHGLAEVESTMVSLESLLADGGSQGNALVNLVCTLRTSAAAAQEFAEICSALVASAATVAFFSGPVGPWVAGALVTVLPALLAYSDLLEVFQELTPRFAGRLDVVLQTVDPQTQQLRVYAPMGNSLQYVCAAPLTFILMRVQDRVISRLTRLLNAQISFQAVSDVLFDQRTGRLRLVIVNSVRTLLAGIGVLVEETQTYQALERAWLGLSSYFCSGQSSSEGLPIPLADLEDLSFSPSSAGSLTMNSAMSATFTCTGTSSAQVVTISARLLVPPCARAYSGTGLLQCGDQVPNMVRIAPGTFQMGSNATTGEPYFSQASERPVHAVTISRPFWIGRYEVTQAEYQAVMGANPSTFQGASWPNSQNRPVENVSWNDAMAYCATLTARERTAGRLPTGYQYRLPTEAEWEYCCRAGTTTEFHYGPTLLCGQANFNYSYHSNTICNSSSTVVVGGYVPNAWGLHDMHGNVVEWCLDSWDESANYPSAAVTDPWVSSGPYRVGRGGSWNDISGHCRSANRYWYSLPAYGVSFIGFRVVLAPVLVP